MKIVMIGHTGVGKTTYMASMYGSMQSSVNGFSLRAADASDHAKLLTMFQEIACNRYPPPTDQRGEYDFHLLYEGDKVFPFHWMDYRGKAITETQASAEAQHLLRDVKEADGIMLFCDSDAMAHGRARSNQIGRMTSLVTQGLQEVSRPVPLVIVLTKADLVPALDDNLLEALSGLITATKASQNVLGTLVQVACGAHGFNVDLPLLFALHIGIVMQTRVLKKEIGRLKLERAQLASKGKTIWGGVYFMAKTYKGEPTYGDQAREAQEAAEKSYESWKNW